MGAGEFLGPWRPAPTITKVSQARSSASGFGRARRVSKAYREVCDASWWLSFDGFEAGSVFSRQLVVAVVGGSGSRWPDDEGVGREMSRRSAREGLFLAWGSISTAFTKENFNIFSGGLGPARDGRGRFSAGGERNRWRLDRGEAGI